MGKNLNIRVFGRVWYAPERLSGITGAEGEGGKK